MRLDDYLSTVGIVKRRTVAKELGANGLIEIGGKRAKPSHQVATGDIIVIKGSRPIHCEILAVPTGSVSKTNRDSFYRTLNQT